ncbi:MULTISPECIES: hypothetical protein [unclassified Sulfurospirillum]|uniref:hypothetical protein n=1 Tax=unclassified Sulfurospirillum TaxID=2618290 RepID=UPI000506967D|nr:MULTISPECIES: hypothetical protein [unclassified Sulfurospirillum]KFL34996.1 hypothetical protein JU57_03260 [Sulfurospirillum sp. SCADC]
MNQQQEEQLFAEILSEENIALYQATESVKDIDQFCMKLEKEFPQFFFIGAPSDDNAVINMYDKSKLRIKRRKTLLERAILSQIEPNFVIDFEQ